MRRILLIDMDSVTPNLALMKLSAYHHQRGDEVGFTTRDPAERARIPVLLANAVFRSWSDERRYR